MSLVSLKAVIRKDLTDPFAASVGEFADAFVAWDNQNLGDCCSAEDAARSLSARNFRVLDWNASIADVGDVEDP